MLVSVHLVDGGIRSTFQALRRTPAPGDCPGLRNASALIAAPLGGVVPSPQPGRLGLVAFWDDERALDGFLGTHPLAESLTGGWCIRLEPVRAVPVAGGPWPGLPDDLPVGSVVPSDEPTAVLTIGRLRLNRTVDFLRTSAQAEKQVASSPGLLWATGLANLTQHVVATFSLWETGEQMRAYATTTTGHRGALRREGERSFHHVASFIRLRPLAAMGGLDGRNPLRDTVTAILNGQHRY